MAFVTCGWRRWQPWGHNLSFQTGHHLGTADPGWHELRAECDDRQDRQARRPLDDQLKKFERAGIGPMRILDHQQHRLTRRQPLDLRYQRLQCLLLALLRGEVERRKAVVDWNRQQTRQQGYGLAEVIRRQGEYRLQSGQPLLVRVVAPEPGRPFELRDARVERRVLVMGRAEQTQARVRLAAQALEDGLGDP